MKTKKTKQENAQVAEPLWPRQLCCLSREEAEQRVSSVADDLESDPHFRMEVAGDYCLVAGELENALKLYGQCQFGENRAANRRNSKIAYCLLHLRGADDPMGALKEAMQLCSASDDITQFQDWLWRFYMQANESVQYGQALLTYHEQLVGLADDEESRRVMLVMTAHNLVMSDAEVAVALEMAAQAGAGGPTIYPKNAYMEHDRISWDVPLAAIRVRVIAALHASNAQDLANAIGDFTSIVSEHPSELPNALYACIGFQIGTTNVFEDSSLAEHDALDRLMAAVSGEQQALLALASVVYDRGIDNPVRLAPLRGKCDLIQQPILRALANAFVAEGGRNLTTFAKCATAVDCFRATYPQLLESVQFDLAPKVQNGESAGEVVGGYIAALKEAPTDGIDPDNNIFNEQLYLVLLEGKHYAALLDAAQAWRATGKGGSLAVFQVGVAHHWLGNLGAAAGCYHETLALSPEHFAALGNLHIIASHQADVETLKELQACVAAAAERHADDESWSSLAGEIATSLKAAEEKSKALKEAKIIEKRLQEVGKRNRNRSIDYSTIPDDIAILLLALDRTLGGQAFERTFFRTDCGSIAPTDSNTFISKLWDADVIADDPAKAQKGGYFLKGDELWHYNNKIAYFVLPDEKCEKPADVMMLLNGRQFTDAGLLRDLWLTYATTDCMAYLYSMMNEHQLELDDEKNAEILAAIRTTLRKHSVSEIWSVIWKIVKDAASLAQRQYYNRAKAAATIPGKFSRHLEGIVKGERKFGNWERPHDQPAGTIGQVFYELFGIDEQTRGTDLDTLLPDAEQVESQLQINMTHELRTGVDHILARVQRTKQGPDMMAAFAEVIADGMPFEDAIAYINRKFSEGEPGQ